MPYRRPDSPDYWISYTDPETGKQIRRAAGPSFAAAKALEQKLRAEAHAAKRRATTDSRLDVILAHYLSTRMTARNRSTVRQLGRLAGHWCGDLSSAVMRGYLRDRQTEGAAAGTINKELAMLSAAVNLWNLDHGASLPNPAKGLKLKEPAGRMRWLTRDEYRRLLANCHGYLHDFVVLAVNTGMRRGELLNLTWDRIDFAQRLITLEAADTKAKKLRHVPLNGDAIAALRRRAACCTGAWVFCSPVVEGPIAEIKHGFATACQRAGLTGVTPHTLRHTTASWLVQDGIPIYEVATILGHSSTAITKRYGHLAPDHLRAAMDVLRDNSVITAPAALVKTIT